MVNRPQILFVLLSACFIGLMMWLLGVQLPEQQSLVSLFQASDNLDILLIQSYTLPRIAIALLAGGMLGLASLLLQQVMANPLASDNTLGISAGSQFALFITAIFAPNWLDISSSAIALVGAGLSLILVLTLAMRKTMSPLLLILAGLVVNLYFGSFSALMMLFYPEEARGLAQWGGRLFGTRELARSAIFGNTSGHLWRINCNVASSAHDTFIKRQQRPKPWSAC